MILDINKFYEEEHTASKSILHGGKEYIAYDEVIRLLKKCNDQQLRLYGVSSTLDLEKMDKKFDELLKQWDSEKLQKWIDSKG